MLHAGWTILGMLRACWVRLGTMQSLWGQALPYAAQTSSLPLSAQDVLAEVHVAHSKLLQQTSTVQTRQQGAISSTINAKLHSAVAVLQEGLVERDQEVGRLECPLSLSCIHTDLF